MTPGPSLHSPLSHTAAAAAAATEFAITADVSGTVTGGGGGREVEQARGHSGMQLYSRSLTKGRMSRDPHRSAPFRWSASSLVDALSLPCVTHLHCAASSPTLPYPRSPLLLLLFLPPLLCCTCPPPFLLPPPLLTTLSTLQRRQQQQQHTLRVRTHRTNTRVAPSLTVDSGVEERRGKGEERGQEGVGPPPSGWTSSRSAPRSLAALSCTRTFTHYTVDQLQ